MNTFKDLNFRTIENQFIRKEKNMGYFTKLKVIGVAIILSFAGINSVFALKFSDATANASSTTICSGSTTSLSLTIGTCSGSSYSITGYQWEQSDNNSTWSAISGATNSTYATPALSANKYYRCVLTVTGSFCNSGASPYTTASRLITVVAQPTTSNAGPDQNVGSSSSAILAGNNPSAGSGTWTVISGSGTFSNANLYNTAVTSLGSGANTFRWTIANSPCSSSTDDVIVTYTPLNSTLYNTAAGSTQTGFHNIIWNTITPTFTASASAAANRFQVELNTKSDFSGTSYTQTFSGSYSAATKYDLTCDGLSPSLPTSGYTYAVRVRASLDAGTTWGSFTTTTWVFTKATNDEGYHYTTNSQFAEGTLVGAAYGNNIVSNDNGTPNDPNDDFLELNAGNKTNTLSANGDHYLTEGTSNFSGASYNFLTIGSAYVSSAQKIDYVGFRFLNCSIPQGATILTAYLNVYASNSGSEPQPNNSNPLYLKVRAADFDNCSAWANTTNTSTGDPLNRTRSATGIDWDITASWSDGELITSPNIASVVQDVVNRSGFACGNAIGLLIDYDGAAHATNNRHRYLSTPARGAGYKAYLTVTYSNYDNDIKFTNIDLSSAKDATSWKELVFDVDKSSCGACDVTFEVRKTSDNSLIASGNTSPIALSSNTTSNVYVVARIKRNSSPFLNSFTITTNGAFPLPINLAYFDAVPFNEQVKLEWITTAEINNDYFTVERSVDGMHFSEVKQVIGAGQSNDVISYNSLDESPLEGVSYYRLKQTDFDGKFEYFQVVPIHFSKAEKNLFSMYPNPLLDSHPLNLNIKGAARDEILIVCQDLLGNTVFSKMVILEDDEQVFVMDQYQTFSPGIYVITGSSNNALYSKKLIVK